MVSGTMNTIYVIGIGFRPLDKKASKSLLSSDVVLANDRLLNVFVGYDEYGSVKEKIIVHDSVNEMLDYIEGHYRSKQIALLAAGDPMFFGIGRPVVGRFGRGSVEVYPDLSSIQVAFSRIREASNNAFFLSFHGGPDPEKRRTLEYEMNELPALMEKHEKIAILTDKVNSPAEIANVVLADAHRIPHFSSVKMYVCARLGYDDEKITEGTPEDIAGTSYAYPNVMIIIQRRGDSKK